MVRWVGANEARGLRIIAVPHDSQVPRDIRERSFRVKRAWVGTQVQLDEAMIRSLTEAFSKRVQAAKPEMRAQMERYFSDWKRLIGYSEDQVEVRGTKQTVITVSRKELRMDYVIFKRWGKWFKLLLPAPFDLVKVDTGAIRGDKVILQGAFDPEPLSRTQRVKKSAWMDSAVNGFKRLNPGKEPSKTLKRKWQREYDDIPKGVMVRVYFLPKELPEYMREVGAAAAARAINEAGITGMEQFAQMMARLPSAEAALEAVKREREELRKELALVQTQLGRAYNQVHDLERIVKEKGMNYVLPSPGPLQAGFSGNPATGPMTSDLGGSGKGMGLGRFAPLLIGVILLVAGIGAIGYGTSLDPKTAGYEGLLYVAGGVTVGFAGGAIAWLRRPRKDTQLQNQGEVTTSANQ